MGSPYIQNPPENTQFSGRFFCFKIIEQECVHNLGEGTHRRIDTLRRFGLLEMR